MKTHYYPTEGVIATGSIHGLEAEWIMILTYAKGILPPYVDIKSIDKTINKIMKNLPLDS